MGKVRFSQVSVCPRRGWGLSLVIDGNPWSEVLSMGGGWSPLVLSLVLPKVLFWVIPGEWEGGTPVRQGRGHPRPGQGVPQACTGGTPAKTGDIVSLPPPPNRRAIACYTVGGIPLAVSRWRTFLLIQIKLWLGFRFILILMFTGEVLTLISHGNRDLTHMRGLVL